MEKPMIGIVTSAVKELSWRKVTNFAEDKELAVAFRVKGRTKDELECELNTIVELSPYIKRVSIEYDGDLLVYRDKFDPLLYLFESVEEGNNWDRGVRVALGHTGDRSSRIKDIDYDGLTGYDAVDEVFGVYQQIYGETDLKVLFENTFMTRDELEILRKKAREFPVMGLCFDPANLNFVDLQPDGFSQTGIDYMVDLIMQGITGKVHLKQLKDGKALPYIGEGDLDMARIINASMESGKDVYMEFLASGTADEQFEYLERSYEFVKGL